MFDDVTDGTQPFGCSSTASFPTTLLDSVLNGASSLVVNDFVRTSREFTERQLLSIGRILVGVFLALAVLWAPVIRTFSGIVEYFPSFLGYVTMPLVVVLLGGVFWRRDSVEAGFWTLILVPVGPIAFFVAEAFKLIDVRFLYATGVMFLFSLGVFVLISLATPPPEGRIAEIRPKQSSNFSVAWGWRSWRRPGSAIAVALLPTTRAPSSSILSATSTGQSP